MVKKKEIKKIGVEEWKATAIELFGEDIKQWKFKCPMCKQTQTVQEFLDNKIEGADGKFSAIHTRVS